MVLVLLATGTTQADTGTILVLPFENLSNDRSLDWIGEGVAELLIEKLQSEPGIQVFSREERLAAHEKLNIPETAIVSRATALKLGWNMGADTIIMGRFSGAIDNFQIVARSINLELTESSPDVKAEGKLEDVISLANTIYSELLRKPDGATPSLTPRTAFENYVRGIVTSDPQKRIDLLQTAIRLYPQYVSAAFQLGRALYIERNFKASNQSLEKIPEGSPWRQQAQFMMGLNYFYLGDYTKSIAVFQKLPSSYDVQLNIGSAFSLKGDPASAIAAWKRASEIDPLASDAFFNIGYANLLKGDIDPAVRSLLESLKLRGRDSEALFLLGRAYDRQGRLDESQKLIAQATRLSQRVERWLAQPLPKLERVSTTATFYNSAEIWTARRLARRARGQDLSAWLDAIQNQIDSYSYGEAIRELQDVIRVFPNSAEARALLTEVNQLRNSR